MVIFAKTALLEDGWAQNVRFDLQGHSIRHIETDAGVSAGDEIHGVIVAGMPNHHSHAFQRAMAGLAEERGPANDSFWSWRNVMYRFALSMTPDHVEAVAAQLYMEMLEAGFTRVGEFHYLHHDTDGKPYSNIGELAERIGAASDATGIGLTLLPVFYAHSGFGGGAPVEGQRRFINSLDSFSKLMEECRKLIATLPGGNLGVAPHSLRAATPAEIAELVTLYGEGPIHIHIAEQTKEVDDCIQWSGRRPVEWLLDNAPVDDRWCLIHATHMTEAETLGIAKSGAIAGLCPITEANLGDGAFPASGFVEAGGRYGIGSDSNISISVAQELKQLEYSQRIRLRSRNVLAERGNSTGLKLFTDAVTGGNVALKAAGGLQTGSRADFVALDTTQVPYLSGNQLLDNWIFADGVKISSVWAGGKKLVEGGRHVHRQAIERRFRAAMAELLQA